MDLEIGGKTALVTGASRGIGLAIAEKLAQAGVNTLLVARSADEIDAHAKRLSRQTKSYAHAADLRAPDAAEKAVAAALARFGRLDFLVNNAGATKRGAFAALTDDDFLDGFALKFHGYVRMTRAAWPALKTAGGAIVNIVGAGGRTAAGDFTIGGSVNAALYNFTKAIAQPATHRTPTNGTLIAVLRTRAVASGSSIDHSFATPKTLRNVASGNTSAPQ